ncbi:MAG: hypothetical protein ACRD15_21350, partial [Vicinamibacterales bacterium]
PETIVAERAVAFARDAQQHDRQNDRRHHVGFYLISRGRFRLEEDLRYSPRVRERLARFVFEHPAVGYLGAIAAATGLGVWGLVAYGHRHGAAAGAMVLIALVALIPVSEFAISVLNSLLTSIIRPRQLPKLALRTGIPAQSRTMVVVPAIIDSAARVDSLVHDLEVRFLANRDPHLHFALLSDFADADVRTLPGDEALVRRAQEAVDALNVRHGADRFFFFHRDRRWNPREGRWMGWERKRGKLAELNRLLRGAADTSFAVVHGDSRVVPAIKYVITLDSDTHLPMETGRRLVGTLSHPLNRPRFDARRQRVTEGYGVLQPRVQVGIESAARTPFAQVFSGHVGLDPYTTAVSDVYQDLFHEGNYVGKGIYDVDAFEAALAGRVPDNALLSHDLFEGFFARAALCTDIHLIDDYPTHYLAFAARQHRWVRGDWQIARWLWRTVPNESGQPVANKLPIISRWKILDNLRRSLMPPALVLLLAAGWTILPGAPVLWTALALAVLAFPAYTQLGRSLSSRIAGVSLREHLLAEKQNIRNGFYQGAFTVIVLAHQAVVILDAIGRVLVRLLVTRRHLLQWVTADRAIVPRSFGGVLRRMWPAAVGALAVAALTARVAVTYAPEALIVAAPILVLWLISPALVYRSGLPLDHGYAPLTGPQRSALRCAARKTWRFFEELLGPADHWLIPDNYQEHRADVIAHRTSPTNIGLQLLSTLAAYDFGYLSTTGVIDRLEPTFDTLLRMQRYRGHFYNWYDTTTLAALQPAYISTVDSGNLAGYLLTLRAGLAELTEGRPLIEPSAIEGLEDVIELFDLSVAAAGSAVATGRLRQQLDELRESLERRPSALAAWRSLFTQVRDRLSSIALLLHELEEPSLADSADEPPPSEFGEPGYWLERAEAAVAGRHAELERLTGWIT